MGFLPMIRMIVIMRTVIPLMFMTMVFFAPAMAVRVAVFMNVVMGMGVFMLVSVLLATVIVRVFMSMLVLVFALVMMLRLSFHSGFFLSSSSYWDPN